MKYFKKSWIDYLSIDDDVFYWINPLLYPYLLILLIVSLVQIIIDFVCNEISFMYTFYTVEKRDLRDCETILMKFDLWERHMKSAKKKIKKFNYRYIDRIKRRKQFLERIETPFKTYSVNHGNVIVKARLLYSGPDAMQDVYPVYEVIGRDGHEVYQKPKMLFENAYTEV